MPVTARPWYRRPNAIVVAGCLAAIITFGVRTSFERAYVAVTHRPDRLVDVGSTRPEHPAARHGG